nr:internal virion protein B-like protein [uncultured Mediterranean phage uvMED]|tara:strand:- start:363 stop:845 length:483 start_codon:yes stop_codon:yes gene_type:complete
MGFLTAITATQATAAAAGVSAVTSVAAARQASAVGRYNQSIQNRNALIAEQEAERIEQQKEFDLARFDQQFAQLQGKTKTAILTSGVQLSGSGLRVLRYNAEQAEVEKDILDYNSKVAESRKLEEANFARMQGTLARQQARAAQFGYYAQAGTSLLKAFG